MHARWQRTQANGKARVLISIFDASRQATIRRRGLSFPRPLSEKGNAVSGRRDKKFERVFKETVGSIDFFQRLIRGNVNLIRQNEVEDQRELDRWSMDSFFGLFLVFGVRIVW